MRPNSEFPILIMAFSSDFLRQSHNFVSIVLDCSAADLSLLHLRQATFLRSALKVSVAPMARSDSDAYCRNTRFPRILTD